MIALRSFDLELALASVVVKRRATDGVVSAVGGATDIAVGAAGSVAGATGSVMGAAGSVAGSAAGALVGAAGLLASPFAFGFDHLASYWRRDDGLFVPARPALIGRASSGPAHESGPIAGAARAPRRGTAAPRRSWADAIDLDGLVAFLRRTHPRNTAEHVAAETGESRETVRKWLKREAAPSFRGTIVLVCVYGPPILQAMLRDEPAWLAATAAGADRLVLAGELAAFRTRLDAAIGPHPLLFPEAAAWPA